MMANDGKRRGFDPRVIAAWIGVPVAILSLTLLVFQNLRAICEATGLFCKTEPPAAIVEQAAIDVHVSTFALPVEADSDLVWLRTKIERNFVELFWSNGHTVAHSLAALGEGKARLEVRGEIARVGEEVNVGASISRGATIIGSAEVSAPLETYKQAYRSLPTALMRFMRVSPKDLKPLDQAKTPTQSLFAWWMFEEARRRAAFNQNEEAIAFLDRAIAADTAFATALWSKGDLLAGLGRASEGEELKSAALALDSDLAKISLLTVRSDPMPTLRRALATQTWREIAPGLSQRVVEAGDYGVRVRAWKFGLGDYRLEAAAADAPRGETVSVMRARADAALAVNAGFWDQDAQGRLTPSGLLIVDGRLVSGPKAGAGSGVLLVKDGKPEIRSSAAPLDPAGVSAAVQAGPILVEPGGKNGMRGDDGVRAQRTAACLGADGSVTLLVTEGGLSLAELTELLLPTTAGGFACDSALNLDGGPSTQASLAVEGEAAEVEGLWNTQAALLVKPRT